LVILKHSSHIGRAAVPTLFKDFLGGPIYWGVFYFTTVVSTDVESQQTESTATSVESTVDVSVVVVVTLLQETNTVATKANDKNTFFMFLIGY
jgi:hypothetical protein